MKQYLQRYLIAVLALIITGFAYAAPQTLTIIYTNDVRGEIEPCG